MMSLLKIVLYCDIILNEVYSHNKIISIYEYILDDLDFHWVNHHGQSITIQDCL